MKKYVFLLVIIPIFSFSQIDFNRYFTNKSLRIDFQLSGNAKQELAILSQTKQEPFWGGNPNKTIPNYNFGDYFAF